MGVEVGLASSDAVVDAIGIAGMDVGVYIAVIVVDSLTRSPSIGVVGKFGVLVEVVLVLTDAVEGAIDIALGIDVGVDTTSMEYACNMSSSNSFILTQSLTAWTRSGSFSRVG